MFVIVFDGFILNLVVVVMFKDLRDEIKEEVDKWKLFQLIVE